MSIKHAHSKGFTLLEIIIALFIFSIISLILANALHNMIRIQSDTKEKATQLAALQTALLFFSQDIEQAIPRPIKNSDEKLEGFIGTKNSLTFTHAGLSNPQGQLNQSQLERVRYEFQKNQFIRTTWPVLDVTSKTKTDSRTLLTFVTQLQFEYLDNTNHWHSKWPDNQQPLLLPKAVNISLSLSNWGKINQLYSITGQTLGLPF